MSLVWDQGGQLLTLCYKCRRRKNFDVFAPHACRLPVRIPIGTDFLHESRAPVRDIFKDGFEGLRSLRFSACLRNTMTCGIRAGNCDKILSSTACKLLHVPLTHRHKQRS